MNNKTTLGEIRFLFNAKTDIYLITDVWSEDGETIIGTERIKSNNLLWGTLGFSEIPVLFNDIYAIGKNKVEIKIDIPTEIFRAWAEYAKKGE